MENQIDTSYDIDQIISNIQYIRTDMENLASILNDHTAYLKTMTDLLTSIKDK